MKKQPGPFAHFVRNVLRDKGLTHEELADQLGVDPSSVSQWVTGRTVPTELNLIKLARLAEVDPDDLIRLKQAVALAKRGVNLPTKSGDILTPEERELLTLYRQDRFQEAVNFLMTRIMKKHAA